MSGKHSFKRNFLRKLLSFIIGFSLFAAIPQCTQATTLGIEVVATTSENQSGVPESVNRSAPTEMEDTSQVDDIGEDDYWENYNVFECFYEEMAHFSEEQWSNGSHGMEAIDESPHNGEGVTLKAYDNGVHDFTVWGDEYDDPGNYTDLWITAPQNSLKEMTLLSADLVGDFGHLDRQNRYGSGDLLISGVQMLDCRENYAVPEPGTFLLLGAGLIGIIAFRRKIFTP